MTYRAFHQLLTVATLNVASIAVTAQVASVTHFVAPSYPPLARQAAISGQITFGVRLANNGHVTDLAEDDPGQPLLSEAAKAAVREWIFQASDRGRVISVTIYYAFSGKKTDTNPATKVSADFEGSTVHVYVTTDPPETVRP
jgi:TonB family protein